MNSLQSERDDIHGGEARRASDRAGRSQSISCPSRLSEKDSLTTLLCQSEAVFCRSPTCLTGRLGSLRPSVEGD